MANISQKTFELIRTRQIKPIRRQIFTLKWLILWFFIFLLFLANGLIFAVFFLSVSLTNWSIYLNYGTLGQILRHFPFFLIILALTLIFVISIAGRRTKRGYYLRRRWLALACLFLSSSFGFLLQTIGWGERIDLLFENRLPRYISAEERSVNLWHNPQKGLLVGEVIEPNSDPIIFEDINHIRWQIILSETQKQTLLSHCRKTGLAGKIEENNTLIFKEIRPVVSKQALCLN